MKYHVLATFALLTLLTSCNRDNIEPDSTLSYEKKWLLDSMRYYYYWNEFIRPNYQLNLGINGFFESLLNPDDRFSFVEDLSEPERPQALEGAYGFRFEILEMQDNERFGLVTYVAETGPAKDAGIERGLVFTQINNEPLPYVIDNDFIKKLLVGDKLVLSISDSNSVRELPVRELTLDAGYVFESPIRIAKTIHLNNFKVGYLFLGRFDVAYNQALIETIQRFKDESINQLVIDLRYNAGGDIGSMALFAFLISNMALEAPFLQLTGNKRFGTTMLSLAECLDTESTAHFHISAAREAKLGLNKIYILTGFETASASEALINCLDAYNDVITIGEKTLGKDVGSVTIEPLSFTATNLRIHPVVYKLSNSNGLGGYSDGIMPVKYLDELTGGIYALGEENEILLQHALMMIMENSVAKIMSRESQAKSNKIKRIERKVLLKSTMDLTPYFRRMDFQ